jgi:thiol peroxidase
MKLSNLLLTILLTFVFQNFATGIASATSLQQSNLQQTTDLVKANNKFVTLLGTQIDVGQKAPNFKVVDADFSPVTLNNFSGKNVLISVVPSLDTGVCSLQTKRFNEEVTNLPQNIVMLTISNDLPFAQKRFCKNESVDKLQVLSDSVWRDFGSKYGLLIKDMGLLTRAIFIIDSSGKVAYKEIVANISKHPNYELALSTIKALSPMDVINTQKKEKK